MQATATAKDSLGNAFGRGDVTWTSSDPSVASVSADGQVAGLVDGPVTITVTVTADGLTATDSVRLKVADPTRYRLYPTADTYVESSTSANNYGRQYGMQVKPPVNGGELQLVPGCRTGSSETSLNTDQIDDRSRVERRFGG